MTDFAQLQIIKNGHVTSPKGFKAGGTHCGLRRKKVDFGWLYSEVPATVAGVYTQNAFQAAPLHVTKESIAVEDKLQMVVVNSANANACTGEIGMANAYETRKLVAERIGVSEHLVAVASTGVIGVQLPMEKLTKGIEQIDLDQSVTADFEQAILTTDTVTKYVAVEVEIEGKVITLGGACKGSGMIHPNMATMLAYITTDANVEAESLQTALKTATNETFNMITVDGDCSTNDTVLAFANGMNMQTELTTDHPEWHKFQDAFTLISQLLAKKIAKDGEGATKLVEVNVKQAESTDSARKIAKAIIGSNLVKTAIYGADPNWGRVICAVGYSNQPIDPSKVTVYLGDIKVVENGLPADFSEEEGKEYLMSENVSVTVELKMGDGEATAWGCDLTYDYVKINASYRT
ncbi:bifunctional glutamate N-acetyltransferase/amino-acid acetyltransferase ArgJ [Paenalkalicoccus suaedae]|uniref:Arginine biosynthesis bifunctional protein ArgJ n=2 Tax=Paenalkalicoccus suaedae TaxID=2592382 RepID=A0A859FKB3_9BACI|nr:bifunctional glutamate N-acetyltransferase/amino-acid acetyltransferase ArgJ [Paenalkalicoccus suaedae]